MKCIAIVAYFVAMAMAESEPFLGWGLGLGYRNAYGRGALGAVPYAHFNPFVHQATAAQYAPIAAVPAAYPYVSTVAIKASPSAPTAVQFHAQDELGNYNYGYDNPNSAKHEAGNTNVGVSGSYTVKDLYGTRTVNYVADALGFRITPAHLRNKRSTGFPFVHPYSPFATGFSVPLARTATPVSPVTPFAARTPVVGITPNHVSATSIRPIQASASVAQYHRQDEFGNYDYGYQNPYSAKQESGNTYTGVTGSYSYIDSFGVRRAVAYVADELGFRLVH